MLNFYFLPFTILLLFQVQFGFSQTGRNAQNQIQTENNNFIKIQLPQTVNGESDSLMATGNLMSQVADGIDDLEHLNVRFFLYTNPSNTSDFQELMLNNTDNLRDSKLLNGKPIKVLVHGFLSREANLYPQNVKDALLKENNGTILRNIINVDWSNTSTPESTNPLLIVPAYLHAVSQISNVGATVAKLLSYFIDQNRTSVDVIHIIGHSLGSHVSGAAGDSISRKYNGDQVSRITGLDPAGPLFYTNTVGRPLTKADAKFVDIIHTDQGAFGKYGEIGHIDFFPNGGTFVQEQCRYNITDPILDFLTVGGYCSHSESHRLYARSVGTTDIKGCKCAFFFGNICYCRSNAVKAVFGDNCSPEYPDGNYYLDMGKYLNMNNQTKTVGIFRSI